MESNKKALKVFSLILLLLIFVAGFNENHARTRRRRRTSRRGRFSLYRALQNPQIAKSAGVSESVRQKALSILTGSMKNSRDKNKNLRKYYYQIRKEYQKERISLESILSISKQINNIKWNIHKQRVTARVNAMNLLTLQQRKKLQEVYRSNRPKRRYRERGGR